MLRQTIERVAADIEARASGRPDPHDVDLSSEIALLHQAELLDAPIVRTPNGYAYDFPHALALPALVRLGGADLSLGRLYEGHLNALQLVSLYGNAQQQTRVADAVGAGVLMGVWGADGLPPLSVEPLDGSTLRLHGTKRYASGLGLVSLALVPYTGEDRTLRLLLLDVSDTTRFDLSTWRMRGMRGSRSGSFDFEGLEVPADAIVGRPDDYRREPYFVGGIWRCAAAQLGAIERIVTLLADGLTAAGRLDHPMQLARIGEAIMATRDARLSVEAAAAAVEGEREAGLAVSLAAFARLRTEAAGMTVVALAERSAGLPVFSNDHPLERILRDLSTYLRQANPDAVLLEHTRVLASRLPELFR